ncbi:ATP-binding cassette domain-containing protein [Alloiococcus otitis]|nr:ABC transporter ATP-binding protein [Alloiococcus otitis]
MTKIQVISNTSAYIMSIICSLIPLFIGGIFVLLNRLEVGALLSIFMASDRIANPLTVALQNYNKLSTTKNIIKKIKAIEANTSSNFNEKNHNCSVLPISFHDASIGYGAEKPIISDLTLEINKGDKILIKGPSGSGKTSLLRSIQGMNDLVSGYVSYGEKADLPSLSIMQGISYIRQLPILFDDTIEFNITLGEHFSDSEIKDAIEKSGLSDIIEEKGMTFQVGENGKNLSGGQNQRIEIARALIRNRDLVIADEVTASLDKKTSTNIRKTLFSIPQAVIEVSHHNNSEELSKYNHVYQISEGTLLEEIF